MNKVAHLAIYTALLFHACSKDEPFTLNNEIPVVNTEATYTVLKEEDITYEENETLDEALNCKYCHCVKKLYLKNQFQLSPKNMIFGHFCYHPLYHLS